MKTTDFEVNMFYYISGTLAHAEPGFAVIDAGGIGYKMTISQTTYDSLPAHLSVDTAPQVKLYSYMSIREDGVELFGFYSYEELSTFKLLISVSGVGPKVALSVLSYFTPEKFALAVVAEDSKALSKASGVGAKTAARIVLELKDKLSREMPSNMSVSAKSLEAPQTSAASKGKLTEAQDALTVLGYTRAEAMSAIRAVYSDELGLEEIIRKALKELMK